MRYIVSPSDLKKAAESNPNLLQEIKNDPEGTLNTLGKQRLPDTWVYRLLVGGLIVVLIVLVVGAIVISTGVLTQGQGDSAQAVQKEIPDFFLAIASGIVGGLAGMFVQSKAE